LAYTSTNAGGSGYAGISLYINGGENLFIGLTGFSNNYWGLAGAQQPTTGVVSSSSASSAAANIVFVYYFDTGNWLLSVTPLATGITRVDRPGQSTNLGYMPANKAFDQIRFCGSGAVNVVSSIVVQIQSAPPTCGVSWRSYVNYFIAGSANGDQNTYSKAVAQTTCLSYGASCTGITCAVSGACTVRNATAFSPSTVGETSYTFNSCPANPGTIRYFKLIQGNSDCLQVSDFTAYSNGSDVAYFKDVFNFGKIYDNAEGGVSSNACPGDPPTWQWNIMNCNPNYIVSKKTASHKRFSGLFWLFFVPQRLYCQ